MRLVQTDGTVHALRVRHQLCTPVIIRVVDGAPHGVFARIRLASQWDRGLFSSRKFLPSLRLCKWRQHSTNRDTGQGLGLPNITVQPQSQTVSVGSGVAFTVTATGESLSYQWYKDNILIPGAITNQLAFGGISFDDEGIYKVIVSNPVGPVTSTNAVLTVVSGPVYHTTRVRFSKVANCRLTLSALRSRFTHGPPQSSRTNDFTPSSNLSTSNLLGAPALSALPTFDSRVLKPTEGTGYTPIDPNYFDSFPRLMTVGWFERYTYTNLYNTLAQDLISFSQAHNRLYKGATDGKVLGALRIEIPTTALRATFIKSPSSSFGTTVARIALSIQLLAVFFGRRRGQFHQSVSSATRARANTSW